MKKIFSWFTAAICTFSIMSTNASYAEQIKDNLWEKFIKYDLCITDYRALTDEEKELCKFIFDTEQAANDNIICERARRILAGDDVGERITIEQLEDAYGIWDNYFIYKDGWQTYIHCVPDVIRLGDGTYFNSLATGISEYWLDDSGSTYVVFNEKTSSDDIRSFDVFDKNGELLKNIPSAMPECPYKDFRGNAEYMEKFGFIEKNGGYYYTKADGTAVFAWSDYTASDSSEPVTEPFIVESDINGCPVVAIETGAFSNSALTEIVLPDTLEFIDRLAFSTCRNLEKINFPENLKYIGNLAFLGCDSLNEIELHCPNLKIMKEAFSDCNELINAILDVKEIDESAFVSCKKLQYVTIGENVTRLGANAFENCSELKSLELSKGTKIIGQAAFLNTEIKSITLLPTVKIIGAYPRKTGREFTSGIESQPARRPLTDDPVCAFDSDCIIYGYRGTEAERYAKEWNLEFIVLEAESGDVNFDGEFNISDVVTLQRWLVGKSNTELTYWKSADLCEDDRLDVFDLCMMKRMLIVKINSN